jgi:hypothetical protein
MRGPPEYHRTDDKFSARNRSKSVPMAGTKHGPRLTLKPKARGNARCQVNWALESTAGFHVGSWLPVAGEDKGR